MQININIAVDVVAALSDSSLKNNIYLMDDSHHDSLNQGKESLSTHCLPGQLINWIIYAVDLQTPVSLKNICFLGADAAVTPHENIATFDMVAHPYVETEHATIDPDQSVWSGTVPYGLQLDTPYHYQLTIQMGHGENSIIHTDAPSLIVCPQNAQVI